MRFWFSLIAIGAILNIFANEPCAKADPLQCSFEQPYPDSPYNICTGYGTFCPARVCAYEPGTPGRFDINGDYEPKVG